MELVLVLVSELSKYPESGSNQELVLGLVKELLWCQVSALGLGQVCPTASEWVLA